MLNVLAIGYYDDLGIFYYIEDFTGFENPYLKSLENSDDLILRYGVNSNNESYRERKITREEAEFLIDLKS